MSKIPPVFSLSNSLLRTRPEKSILIFDSTQYIYTQALEALGREDDPEKAKELAGELLIKVSNLLRLKGISGEESLADALENLLKIYEIKESP